MAHPRKGVRPFIVGSIAALTLTSLVCGRPSLAAASSSDDDPPTGKVTSGSQISDFFASLRDNFKKSPGVDSDAPNQVEDVDLTQLGKVSLSEFLQSQTRGPSGQEHVQSDIDKGKPNRRKILYDLSVRGHYERLLHQGLNNTAHVTPIEDGLAVADYFNAGMLSKFDLRKMAQDDNLLSRFSHWTYRIHPKKSISQLHLVPSAISDSKDSSSKVLKLPPHSILSDTIQFSVETVHDLGTYLSPQSPIYEATIRAIWGEAQNDDHIEYYIDGDTCSYKRKGRKEIATRRQSKVIYDARCCDRRQSMMEDFFHNDGQIMIQSTDEPEPCQYVLRACSICKEEVNEEQSHDDTDGIHPAVDPADFNHLLGQYLHYSPFEPETMGPEVAFPPMPPSQIEANKKLLQSMFTHAYDSYFHNAFPASELKPISCTAGTFDLVRVPALTLVDTLDTLIIMGNFTEFARSVERLRYLNGVMKHEYQQMKKEKTVRSRSSRADANEEGGLFSINQNVSVFETTIRVLGGLLSAHQMAIAFMANMVSQSNVWGPSGEVLVGNSTAVDTGPHSSGSEGSECSPPWEYDGFLLELAHDVGKRLLPAFDTETGIPYGTVNLLNGVPDDETPVASLAGAGTLSLEFELLSRLTGDPTFGKAAKLATRALWLRRSKELNLFGKHIDGQSGKWKENLSGVGSNSDSFYEYLIKHYILFPDDTDFWTMFVTVYSGVYENSQLGEWYVDVDMGLGLNGHVRQVFESLMAFYPGMQVLLGEIVPAVKTLNSFFLVREFLGLLPERFNFAHWKVEGSGGIHPLRPELLESAYFLHLASIGLNSRGPGSKSHHSSSWLWAADFALTAVNKLSFTHCGFATVTGVGPSTTGSINFVRGNLDPLAEQKRLNTQHEDEMPSYFLSETIKYLYLTFDGNNILHTDTEREWVFTTEAHPIHYTPKHGNDLQVQLEKVRSLLKESISDSQPSSDVNTDDGISLHLEHEQWTSKTSDSSFVESLQKVKSELMDHKLQSLKIHEYESGPSFMHRHQSSSETPHDLYSSEITNINQARDTFNSRGKGTGRSLGKSCPNLHHPDLAWTIALHSSLEYSASHTSSLLNGAFNSHDGVDERMLTALSSVCFYGTNYHNGRTSVDENKSCPIEEAPAAKATIAKPQQKQKQLQFSTSFPIPGATRYDMGGNLGQFDVSAFPGGDGFIVRHVNTDELLEVSIFNDNQESEWVILAVLTIPSIQPDPKSGDDSALSSHSLSRKLVGGKWRRQNHSNAKIDETSGEGTDVDETTPVKDEKRVVVADLNMNSFKCEVVVTRKDSEGEIVFLSSVPCTPACFGKANLSSLVESGGEIVVGSLSLPEAGNEMGCNPPDTNPADVDQPKLDQIQMVRRGDCNFNQKVKNLHLSGHRGIIVINSNPHELFVMAGEKPQPGSEYPPKDDLPVAVLVAGNDGDELAKIAYGEQIKGNQIDATILLSKQSEQFLEFPLVQGSNEVLSVLAKNQWGIQAVLQSAEGGWQLFVTQHNKKE